MVNDVLQQRKCKNPWPVRRLLISNVSYIQDVERDMATFSHHSRRRPSLHADLPCGPSHVHLCHFARRQRFRAADGG
jgi:hypothetical protein